MMVCSLQIILYHMYEKYKEIVSILIILLIVLCVGFFLVHYPVEFTVALCGIVVFLWLFIDID